MPAIKELLRAEADGRLSFGDYTLTSKAKMPDFEHQGDIYYVKTFQESTRLEKNCMFVYESVPGTAVKMCIRDRESDLRPHSSRQNSPDAL